MARRAAIFTQSDFDRAVKAAAKVGYAVEIRPGAIAIVPNAKASENSSVPASGADEESNPWDAALA